MALTGLLLMFRYDARVQYAYISIQQLETQVIFGSLVRAIHQYENNTGQPPPDLADLVPDYLPSVPRTGLPAYPDYEYSTGHAPDRWDGNPWVLYVLTSSGGINFDQFLYFPLQNYPESGCGGALQRIGAWAYVHE